MNCCMLVLLVAMTASCGPGKLLKFKMQQQMTEHVKLLETNEYDLLYLNQTYDEYLAAVDGIVSEAYLESLSDHIVFGYNDVNYTREDLAGMSQQDYTKHKEHMIGILHELGLDQVKVTIRLSDVYRGESESEAYMYTRETKELKDQPFTLTTKQYKLEMQDRRWTIVAVKQEKYTYDNKLTEAENESAARALPFQKVDDHTITYKSTLVFPSVGEE